MYIAVVEPPSNIRRIIYDFQVSLFGRTSNPAAMALPPHIPLAFFEEPPPRPGGTVQQASFVSTGFAELPPWLFLEFQPVREFERLRSLLPETSLPPWYPTGRGAPLSRSEASADLPAEQWPLLRWKTSHVVCLELKTDNCRSWWEHLEFREIWRIKLKRRIG